jgi:23S rRNA (pseudouridine1915-N3)-methyltransferase
MNVEIIRVAKGRVKWADAGSEEYLKRIHLWKVSETTIKPIYRGAVSERRSFESQDVRKRLKSTDRVIVLDERGEQVSSEVFASWMQASMDEGVKRVVFVIGGPFGHDASLRKEAWKTLGFSPLVLNHELVRVVLSEQLYRASTILQGGSYHH